MGSGTTNFVAQRMNRNSIGIEILPRELNNMVKEQLESIKLLLLEQNEYESTELNGR